MSNSSAAFFAQNQKNTDETPATAQPVSTPPASDITTQNPQQKTQEPHKMLTLTPKQLLDEVTGMSTDKEFWYLTYMTHEPEFFRIRDKKDQNRPGSIRMMYNPLCFEKEPVSRLELITKTAAYRADEPDMYKDFYFINESKPCKCPVSKDCLGQHPFCIPRMQAFIEYHCRNNGTTPESVYQSILGDDFRPKPKISKDKKYQIPAAEYDFLDVSSAIAAGELIKTKWIRLKENSDTRISYVYLPICENTTRSFVPQALEFYRTQAGKHDFLRADHLREELRENRKCTGCIFPQCPDKVAAYILTLAQKYSADPLELIEFVIKANKINGISLRGNFKYLERVRALNDVDFTMESRAEMDKIIRYIINHRTEAGSKAPVLPFHLGIYTKDEQVAEDVAQIFRDTVYYYGYMKDCSPLKEYRFSEGGLSGLIEFIDDLKDPCVLHIKEMALLGVDTNMSQNQIMEMTKLNNMIQAKQDKLFVIVTGEKAKLDTALGAYPDFYLGTLLYKLTISEMPTGKVLDTILRNLEKDYRLEDGFAQQLEYYVISQYAETPLKGKAFIEMITQTILFNHFNQDFSADNMLKVKDIPMAANRRTDEEIWSDLNELTGLQTVKDEVRNIQQLLKLQKKMTALTAKTMQRPNMHMVFAGNPGTGKTTVARLLAEILYNLGYVRQNKLVEVSPKDLVGRYVGQTAPKTAAVCESAYDGVLFIDEAYELAVFGNGSTDQFRSECITELIKQMEDNRERLVVIFAGYTDEMRDLLSSNAGFASRVGKIIFFEDYTVDQLVDMFVNLVNKNGMHIREAAEAEVRRAVERAKATEHFGNARYVRNLYEDTIREHAKNTVYTEDPDVLLEITVQDIPFI